MNPLHPDDFTDNQGYILANLLHFGRLLRQSGIPTSSQQIYDLADGITHIDISRREDFYFTTRAYLLHNIDKLDQFNLAFDLFWTQQIKAMLEFFVGHRTSNQLITEDLIEQGEQKIHDRGIYPSAVHTDENHQTHYPVEKKLIPIYSSNEVLYRKDFADLNEQDLIAAKTLIRNFVWELGHKRSRRRIRATKQTGLLDFRRSLRKNIVSGSELITFKWQRRKLKPRPLVVLSDISGSMERYSHMFLYFLYAIVQNSKRIETFVFGTRLTRLTPTLRHRNVEAIFSELSNLIMDWSGGTRIGESLKDFNYQWSRRVLGNGAVVVIISDGWDRGDVDLLRREISRLRRRVKKIIWLNPLSGSPDYEPLVQGIRAVMPYVDDFYPFNNLWSLELLVEKLGVIDF